jgi:hypothetical protein
MGDVLVTRIEGQWMGNRTNLINLGFFLKQTFKRSAEFDIMAQALNRFAIGALVVGVVLNRDLFRVL